jgi:hypothetical protein
LEHFSIEPSKKEKEKWIVCRGINTKPFIDVEFENYDIAIKVANKLNDVYQMGVRDTKEQTMDNLRNLLFKE